MCFLKIKKMNRMVSVMICFFMSLSIISSPFISSAETLTPSLNSETNNSIDINTGIANLNYNKDSILAANGDKVEHFVPKEGIYSDGKFIVIEREKKSLTTSPVDISIIDSMANRSYPGALQLANQAFTNNQPTVISSSRQPLNISIDLPGMREENTITVDNPTYGNVAGAIDELVSIWNEKYSDTHTIPARIQYSESMVYSKSQIAAALNVNAQVLDSSLGIDFDAISNDEKKVMVAAYKQIFYSVSAELPNNPSDLFDDSVTFEELTRKGISNEAPPVMVSNVGYGRTIYVKLETNSKSKDVQAAFRALLQNADLDLETRLKYQEIFEDSSFTAVVLGGDSAEHNKVVTKDFDVIRNIIKDNSEFSLKNPAYPISYTSIFLKDNSIASVKNSTEYIETTSTVYSKGKISLEHTGAYIARFEVSWDEISYDINGNEVLTHKTWEGNNKNRTARYSTVIPLPSNSKNIRIKAEEHTGLIWEGWRTVIDEYNVPLFNEIKVSIWSTTLHPKGSISYIN
ncbi:thiol-activated cytolysin family protein [Chengkuizengella sediminis]|uniref:thiol-activated cytolysin family protein n=1 Tax=Chengkuizengella sediminis TaxID=1885917 RepID=UPI003B834DA7